MMIWYNPIKYNAILRNPIWYYMIQNDTIQFDIIWYNVFLIYQGNMSKNQEIRNKKKSPLRMLSNYHWEINLLAFGFL